MIVDIKWGDEILVDDQNYYLLVFSSHNQAIYLFNSLARKGYNLELVSTPCVLSSGCTQSLKFSESNRMSILNEVGLMNASIKGLYKIVRKDNKEFYELV